VDVSESEVGAIASTHGEAGGGTRTQNNGWAGAGTAASARVGRSRVGRDQAPAHLEAGGSARTRAAARTTRGGWEQAP
jgi:hypothetical protein